MATQRPSGILWAATAAAMETPKEESWWAPKKMAIASGKLCAAMAIPVKA